MIHLVQSNTAAKARETESLRTLMLKIEVCTFSGVSCPIDQSQVQN